MQACKSVKSSFVVTYDIFDMLTAVPHRQDFLPKSQSSRLWKVSWIKSNVTVNSSVGALDRQRHNPKAFPSQDVHLLPDSESNSLQSTLKFSFFMQIQKSHFPVEKNGLIGTHQAAYLPTCPLSLLWPQNVRRYCDPQFPRRHLRRAPNCFSQKR